ncbi:MAG: hypothetical protein JNL01_12865 [Bdellovibrionales bacterium]|nr:hypothetical protein [Bdellovibrionales bacterium]
MKKLLRSCVWVLTVLAAAGCATSSSNLKPEKIGQGEGGFFGNIRIVSKGEDVTGKCYVLFSDLEKSRKAYLNLDASGWVFTKAKSGDTQIGGVLCTLGGLVKYNVMPELKGLEFKIGDRTSASYFGHVTIDLNHDASNVTGATIMLGSVGNSIAAQSGQGIPIVKVENKFDSALKEYQKRLGDAATGLKTVQATVSNGGARVPAAGGK